MVMIVIDDPIYYSKLFARYERMEARRTDQRQWLDAGYYMGLQKWLQKEYNCQQYGNAGLSFDNEHDHLLFLLKWQEQHPDDLI